MAKIVYILDTSVPATDPRAPLILSEGNVVVIPFPLLEELDGLKSSSRDIAPYARQAIRVFNLTHMNRGRNAYQASHCPSLADHMLAE